MDEQKLVYTVPEVAKKIGIARGEAYKLARSGRIPTIRIGEKRIIVPVQAFENWLSQRALENLNT